MLRRIISSAALVAAALFGVISPAFAVQDSLPEQEREGLVIEAIEFAGAENRDAEILEGIPLRVGTKFQSRGARGRNQ
jgi:hypothetical protein